MMHGIAQLGGHPTSSAPGSELFQLVDRALRRLHESMREFCAAWPVARRTPLHLSRDLDVDRTTCQRVTSLAKAPYAGFAMLDTVPGPRALRKLLQACESAKAAPSPRIRARFRSAVDGLDEIINSVGSLSELKRQIAAADVPPRSGTTMSSQFSAQEAFFHAASELTGRCAQVGMSIGLYDKVGVDASELRHLRISGSRGVVAQPNALPMVLEAFDGVSAPEEADAHSPQVEQRWQRTPALLREFTSANWRSVELHPSQGFASRAMEITPSQEPSDVFIYTAFPVPDPQARLKSEEDPQGGAAQDLIEESWYILYNPTAALIFDLYLHESIARLCLLSLDVHAWQTSFANAPHGRWHTRLPHAPPILQIGRGIGAQAAPGSIASEHPHHVRLTQELFRRADVDPAEYIGFRCEERFPIWRTGYRYELDFGRAD